MSARWLGCQRSTEILWLNFLTLIRQHSKSCAEDSIEASQRYCRNSIWHIIICEDVSTMYSRPIVTVEFGINGDHETSMDHTTHPITHHTRRWGVESRMIWCTASLSWIRQLISMLLLMLFGLWNNSDRLEPWLGLSDRCINKSHEFSNYCCFISWSIASILSRRNELRFFFSVSKQEAIFSIIRGRLWKFINAKKHH